MRLITRPGWALFTVTAFALLASSPGAHSQSNNAPTSTNKQLTWSGPQATGHEGTQLRCRPSSEKSIQVTEIIDAKSLRLDDGRVVKLIDLETAVPIELHGATLTRFLKKLTLGKSAQLMSTHRKTDRYGRHMAHLFVKRNGSLVWVQAEIIKQGLGLVAPEPGGYSKGSSPSFSAKCIGDLLRLEKEARKNRRGFWGDKIFQIRNAWRARELSKYIQTFQIIEGRIKRLSLSRGKIYINFGRNWKSDMTIVVNKAIMKQMQLGPDNLDQLKGKTIRIRGWLEDRNGPLIRVRNRHQLEIINDVAQKF